MVFKVSLQLICGSCQSVKITNIITCADSTDAKSRTRTEDINVINDTYPYRNSWIVFNSVIRDIVKKKTNLRLTDQNVSSLSQKPVCSSQNSLLGHTWTYMKTLSKCLVGDHRRKKNCWRTLFRHLVRPQENKTENGFQANYILVLT